MVLRGRGGKGGEGIEESQWRTWAKLQNTGKGRIDNAEKLLSISSMSMIAQVILGSVQLKAGFD